MKYGRGFLNALFLSILSMKVTQAKVAYKAVTFFADIDFH